VRGVEAVAASWKEAAKVLGAKKKSRHQSGDIRC
jgi:hypothetical protein